MDKFRGEFRVQTTRLTGWDYGSNAGYFVTVCTANRIYSFGKIDAGSMQLTPLGVVAADCWTAIPVHFPFVILDEFVVMPNHVHGILIINKETVETQNFASLHGNLFGPQSQNLASIIRGYKIGVTKFARQNCLPFEWQPRYHDHIIRDSGDYERIRQYICDNPMKWMADTYYNLP